MECTLEKTLTEEVADVFTSRVLNEDPWECWCFHYLFFVCSILIPRTFYVPHAVADCHAVNRYPQGPAHIFCPDTWLGLRHHILPLEMIGVEFIVYMCTLYSIKNGSYKLLALLSANSEWTFSLLFWTGQLVRSFEGRDEEPPPGEAGGSEELLPFSGLAEHVFWFKVAKHIIYNHFITILVIFPICFWNSNVLRWWEPALCFFHLTRLSWPSLQ